MGIGIGIGIKFFKPIFLNFSKVEWQLNTSMLWNTITTTWD